MTDSEESLSDDDFSFGKKCFDVELPVDFDPNIVPSNGIEYLQLCMYDAKNRPKVVCMTEEQKVLRGLKNKSEEMCKSTASVNLEKYEFEDFYTTPNQMSYTLNWLLEKETDFKKLRDYIWCQYNYDNRLSTVGENCPEISDSLFLTEFPTIEMLVDMPSLKMNKCLKVIMNLLKNTPSGKSISYNLGMWIYILIAANFKYADATMANIRNISRILSQIRKNLSSNATLEEYTPINLITALIGHTLGQYDLSDNKEITKRYCLLLEGRK